MTEKKIKKIEKLSEDKIEKLENRTVVNKNPRKHNGFTK